mmetsp:Transcript_20847/g.28701  ORF Transcript_20847/g.28701 Transcript_20847/m.28701 type:complete len:271 (+) Transcript_20847:388-1200(+)
MNHPPLGQQSSQLIHPPRNPLYRHLLGLLSDQLSVLQRNHLLSLHPNLRSNPHSLPLRSPRCRLLCFQHSFLQWLHRSSLPSHLPSNLPESHPGPLLICPHRIPVRVHLANQALSPFAILPANLPASLVASHLVSLHVNLLPALRTPPLSPPSNPRVSHRHSRHQSRLCRRPSLPHSLLCSQKTVPAPSPAHSLPAAPPIQLHSLPPSPRSPLPSRPNSHQLNLHRIPPLSHRILLLSLLRNLLYNPLCSPLRCCKTQEVQARSCFKMLQ